MSSNLNSHEPSFQQPSRQMVSIPSSEGVIFDHDLWSLPAYDFTPMVHDSESAEYYPRTSSSHNCSQSGVPSMVSGISVNIGQQQRYSPAIACSWRGLQSSKSLPRHRSRYSTRRTQQVSHPISIPLPNLDFHNQSAMTYSSNEPDPLERWRNSPPEFEPASITAINQALVDFSAQPYSQPEKWATPSQPRGTSFVTHSPPFRTHQPRSSAASSESCLSDSSQKSASSSSSRNRARLQARRTRKSRGKDDGDIRRFKCTFCCDSFRTKYDWARHEKSLHLDVEQWRCAPYGIIVFSQVTGRIHCAFCNALDPNDEHLKQHGHESCTDPTRPTMFHRKDHLIQHLRLVHKLSSMPRIEDWKFNEAPLSARCGFCDLIVSSWDERTAHLSEHFRQGMDMTHWRGDHNFDATTAAKVRNAIPPYCIGDESYAIVPFKPADSETQDQFNQISSSINSINLGMSEIQSVGGNLFAGSGVIDTHGIGTESERIMSRSGAYIDLLASHLGRFAREQILLGVTPTDEMFQAEARRVIYDCESDGWNTTVADNENWLRSFKEQMGPFN